MSSEEKMLAELAKIRELLTPPTPPPTPLKPKNIFEEFKEFLDKYKVFPLAVAFIMGRYVGDVIQAIVNDLIMPLLFLALPDPAAWNEWAPGGFLLGHFFGTLITFVIVAFIIFLLVKLINIDYKSKIAKSSQELKEKLSSTFKKK